MTQIIKASDLNVSELVFSDVKVDQHGRKIIYVNHKNGKKVLIQTPKMLNVFGGKRWVKEGMEDAFEVEMSFAGKESNPELQKFHDILGEFDETVKDQIILNSKAWLGKAKISKDSINETELYTSVLKLSKDKDGSILEYPSRFKVKFDKSNNSNTFVSNKRSDTRALMFDENSEEIEFNQDNFENVICKSSQLISVVELVYITISTKVSVKFKFFQGRVFSNKNIVNHNIMLQDSQDNIVDLADDLDNVDLEAESVEEPVEIEEVEESAEVEVEEEIEPEVEEEPIAPVKKSRATKKA
jgi:hypothetical protein